mgnify:CR=1 FL=1
MKYKAFDHGVNIITLESVDKLNYCDAINKIINKFPINNVKGTK